MCLGTEPLGKDSERAPQQDMGTMPSPPPLYTFIFSFITSVFHDLTMSTIILYPFFGTTNHALRLVTPYRRPSQRHKPNLTHLQPVSFPFSSTPPSLSIINALLFLKASREPGFAWHPHAYGQICHGPEYITHPSHPAHLAHRLPPILHAHSAVILTHLFPFHRSYKARTASEAPHPPIPSPSLDPVPSPLHRISPPLAYSLPPHLRASAMKKSEGQ